MKQLTQRAMKALAYAGYSTLDNDAICGLTAFAAQDSGIEWRNYFSDSRDLAGLLGYQRESRQIAHDWHEFRHALKEAQGEGVTGANVINAAPHAYGGRLSWNQDRWEYCTGQYFCTEYRRAAIVVLEHATRTVRKSRPPQRAEIRSIRDLKDLNTRNGGCWFSRDTMRFFGTRIESGIIHGRYFITSEQPPQGERRYSVRSFNSTGEIDTEGEFCSHQTKTAARDAVAKLQPGQFTNPATVSTKPAQMID